MLITRAIIDEYVEKNRELNKINAQIDYYSSKIPRGEHGVVQSSMRDYPFATTHIVLSGSDIKSDEERQAKLKQLLVSLSQKKQEYEDMTLAIEIGIGEMDNEIGTIFFYKYVQGRTDKDIANELGYERSTITKKINAYFEEQSKLFT